LAGNYQQITADSALRQLYGATYRAFRNRRSLLLINLQKQVQIEELPWVAAIEGFRNENMSDREMARHALKEITVLTIASFPHMIFPNKLLQEMNALAKGAADLLEQSLYAAYYGIDYKEIKKLPDLLRRQQS
jgi:hypothetical protein